MGRMRTQTVIREATPEDARAIATVHVASWRTTYRGLLRDAYLDSLDLEALSAACAERNRWTFMFVIAPLRIEGGTGSPVNPIAVF